MFSWLLDKLHRLAVHVCVNTLKTGQIPRHVAVIMDGNRRFARSKNMQIKEGHAKGGDTLQSFQDWCLQLGVQEITVYAFSIENFKRPREEVDDLMELITRNLRRWTDDLDRLERERIRYRFVGNLSLLPPDVRALCSRLATMTRRYDRLVANVAVAYTGREEITQAVSAIVKGVHQGSILATDVDEDLISGCMYTDARRPPDLLLRTSGEARLSDFLLWQTTACRIEFVQPTWPEMRFWDLFKVLFKYQAQFDNLATLRSVHKPVEFDERRMKFVEALKCSRDSKVQ